MPRYAADRVLLASLADVWAFLAEPYNLADWFPGVSGVEPDRRGLAPGARWKVIGPNEPSYFRRPQLGGSLLVLEVVPLRHVSFQLTSEHAEVGLDLEPVEDGETQATLAVEAPRFGGMGRDVPSQALAGLAALVRQPAE